MSTSWEICFSYICKVKGAHLLCVTAVNTAVHRVCFYNKFSANFNIEWSRVFFKCHFTAFKVFILKQYFFFYNGRRHHVICSRRMCYKILRGAIPLNNSTSYWAASWENRQFAYAKTKTQISFAVIAQLISTFVFAT